MTFPEAELSLVSPESSSRTLTYSDIVPSEVPFEVYERTKENLEAQSWWEIFKVGAVSLRELVKEGKISNYAHGTDTDQMLDYVPPTMEIAVNPKKRTLEPINQPLSTQKTQLVQLLSDINHPMWLDEGKELEPEEKVEGVKVSLLPGAVVVQLAEAFSEKNGSSLLEDVTLHQTEGGVLKKVTSFALSCIDSPDGRWRLSVRPDVHTSGKFMISLWEGGVKEPQVRVLRALILPTPKKS